MFLDFSSDIIPVIPHCSPKRLQEFLFILFERRERCWPLITTVHGLPRYFLHVEGPPVWILAISTKWVTIPKQLVCDFIILDEHLTRLFHGRRGGDLDSAVLLGTLGTLSYDSQELWLIVDSRTRTVFSMRSTSEIRASDTSHSWNNETVFSCRLFSLNWIFTNIYR